MVSNKYRSNNNLGNKISNLDSRTSRTEKKTSDPHLSSNAVTGDNIKDQSVDSEVFAPRAVDDKALDRGSVTTENLGVINRIKSDNDLEIMLPGWLYLTGAGYPEVPVGLEYPLGQRSDGSIVQSRTTWDAIVDPLWTTGNPNITMVSTGATHLATGWAKHVDPQPGDPVKVVNDGNSYFITAVSQAGIQYPNQAPLELKNGWTIYDSNWSAPRVAKTTEGIVQLTGLIRAGVVTVGTSVTQLPEGLRPDYDMVFGVSNSDTNKRVMVRKSGDVEIYGNSWVAGSWLSLSSIVYPAAGVAAWQRFGVDAGFTYANSWTAWQFPADYYSHSFGGGTGVTTFETSGGPAPSPNDWVKLSMTSASTSLIMLANGNQVSNRINPGVQNTAKIWVRVNAPTTVIVDRVYYDAAGTTMGVGGGTATALAANTWTQITNTSTAPAGTFRGIVRAVINSAVPSGTELGISNIELYETVSTNNLKNDAGPLRMWQDPITKQIWVQGVIAGGTAVANTAFTGTLPTAYRPSGNYRFYTVAYDDVYGQFRVDDGTLSPNNAMVYEDGDATLMPVNTVYEPATGTTLSWTAMSLTGGWVSTAAPYKGPYYAKSPGGMVFMHGAIRTGTIGTNYATLPAGYRPKPQSGTNALIYHVASNGARGRINVRGDGTLNPNAGSNVWFSMSGVTWVAEQ